MELYLDLGRYQLVEGHSRLSSNSHFTRDGALLAIRIVLTGRAQLLDLGSDLA